MSKFSKVMVKGGMRGKSVEIFEDYNEEKNAK